MTKKELVQKNDNAVTEIQSALQTIYDALNQGQQQKLLKNAAVKTLLDRYNVEYAL